MIARTKAPKCDHPHTWFLRKGTIQWCYRCGAIRRTGFMRNGKLVLVKRPWVVPTGKDGNNPYHNSFDAMSAQEKK